MDAKRVVLGVGLMVAVGGLGCGSMNPFQDKGYSYPMQLNKQIPGAMATVDVTPQDDGNKKVEIKAKYLAPPQAVDPQAQAYVVWIKPAGGEAQNVGVLTVGKNREGSFQARTPYERFDLLVTAEREINAREPRESTLMRASVTAPTRGVY